MVIRQMTYVNLEPMHVYIECTLYTVTTVQSLYSKLQCIPKKTYSFVIFKKGLHQYSLGKPIAL